jgi:hypothetical protein
MKQLGEALARVAQFAIMGPIKSPLQKESGQPQAIKDIVDIFHGILRSLKLVPLLNMPWSSA